MDLKNGEKKTKDIQNPSPDFFIVRFKRHKRTLSSCYKCFCVLPLGAIPLSAQTNDKQLKGAVILRAYTGQQHVRCLSRELRVKFPHLFLIKVQNQPVDFLLIKCIFLYFMKCSLSLAGYSLFQYTDKTQDGQS